MLCFICDPHSAARILYLRRSPQKILPEHHFCVPLARLSKGHANRVGTAVGHSRGRGGGHADPARASSEGSYQPASLGKKLLENQVTSDLFVSSRSYFNTNKVYRKQLQDNVRHLLSTKYTRTQGLARSTSDWRALLSGSSWGLTERQR